MCGSSALPSSSCISVHVWGFKCACVSVTVGVNVLHSGWYLDVKMDFRIHIMLHYKFNPASVIKVSTPVFITKNLSPHLTRNTILFQIFINLKLQR